MTRRDRRKARHAKYAWQAGMSGLALVLLLAACASAQSAAPAPPAQMSASIPAEPELRERVAKWWTARQQRDHALMYELYEPAYRERVDMRSFLQESLIRSRFDIASHSIQQIAPGDGAKARVKLEVAVSWPRSATPYSTTVEESWIHVNGHWYKVHQPQQLPFPANGPQ